MWDAFADSGWVSVGLTVIGMIGGTAAVGSGVAKAVIASRFRAVDEKVGLLHVKIGAAEGQMQRYGDKLAADTENAVRDLWQVVDVERRSGQAFREKMLAEGATQARVSEGFVGIERRFDRLELRMERIAQAAQSAAASRAERRQGSQN